MSCRPGAAAGWRGQAITHSAGGQRNRLSAGRPGEVLWQLTGSDVISLAINVVQNGFDYRQLHPDLAFFVGASATKPRGRGQSGEAPLPDTTRLMLEEVYQEILRANAQHMGANDSLPSGLRT